jgi:uncharacterized protein (TIGR03083 family)
MVRGMTASEIATMSARLADLAQAHPQRQIEHCPEWVMNDLACHLGDVQWFWSEIISNRLQSREEVIDNRPADRGADGAGWLRSQTPRLVEALDNAADTESIWTWWEPGQHVGFVRRRQLIEVAVHMWDAENAASESSVMTDEVALVGLDEFVEVMADDLRADHPAPGPVRLIATGTDWKATLFENSDQRGGTIEATPVELLLQLWNRWPVTDPIVQRSLAALDLS